MTLESLAGVLSMFFKSPLAQGIFTILGGLDEQRATEDFNRANRERLEQILSGSESLESRLLQNRRAMSDEESQAINELEQSLTGETESRGEARISEFDSERRRLEGFSRSGNASLLSALDRLTSDVGGRLAERTERGLGFLEGASEQGRADVGERFDRLSSEVGQNLVSRGLGGTVAAGAQRGVERDRGAELRRFDEGVRREFMDAFTSLTGDEISAAQELGLARAGFQQRGQETSLALAERLAAQRIGMGTDLDNQLLQMLRTFGGARLASTEQGNRDILSIMGQQGQFRLNTLGNVQDIPPQSVWMQLANSFGRNAAGAPGGGGGGSSNSWIAPATGYLGAGAAGTIGVAGTGVAVGAGKAIAGIFTFGLGALGCVDADTWVFTPQGEKKIKDIKPGDTVLTEEDRFVAVVEVVCGPTPKEREDEFVRIDTGMESLVVTKDHVVSGVPAGQIVRDFIIRNSVNAPRTVVSISPVAAPEFSADLRLEDDGGYIANRLPVDSMISRYAYRKHRSVEPVHAN